MKKIDPKNFRKKIGKKIWNFLKISKTEKSKIFDFSILEIFENFLGRFFFGFFSELRKKNGYNFDVKFSDLSMHDVFRAFGVRQIWFPAPTRYTTLCLRASKTWCFEGLQWKSVWLNLIVSEFSIFEKTKILREKNFRRKKIRKCFFSSKIKSICLELQHNQRRASNSFSKSFFH